LLEADFSGKQGASSRLWTPPNRHLPPTDPLSTPLGQVLTLGDQTLMDRTGQHRDAVPADLVAEVLADRHAKTWQSCSKTERRG